MCFDIVLLAVSFWLISLTSVAIAAARNWPEMMENLVHISHNLFLPFLLRWLLPLSLPQAAVRYGADPRVFSIMSKVYVRVLYKYRSRYFSYLCSTKLWSYFRFTNLYIFSCVQEFIGDAKGHVKGIRTVEINWVQVRVLFPWHSSVGIGC